MDPQPPGPTPRLLTLDALAALLDALRTDGYQLMGPTVRDGAIVHAPIAGLGELPRGWTEVQEAGTYRLVRRDDDALFGYSVGPQSWKQVFFVPRLRLFTVRRSDAGMSIEPEDAPAPKLALIGTRSCDLHAIEIQDRTFLQGPHIEPDYAARRQDTFVVAVNCGQAGGTCFCVSMKTGPKATLGFDIALTELFKPHRFLADAGSERGSALLDRIASGTADASDVTAADQTVAVTAASMGRQMETSDIKPLLYRNLEHPRWDDVADRCLSCTNCTLVCPTCFCATVEDTSDLAGTTAERWRRWDSCFTLDHSYLHGGSVRATTRARYRQWLTHKLASWIDQFGTSGCVGCGRCITWCPVGIDITREVAAIRDTDGVTRDGTAT
jgi:formate hydrogenlyase subunit 6/NADH:ubiquinone oxidoreductase subunit I